MTAREYLVVMSAIWIIVIFVILIISHLAYGDDNYCSVSEAWLNVTHVEYCILNGKPIQCDTEIDQILCQQVAKQLGAINDSDQCDIDESLCVLEKPDPDLEDDGMEEFGYCEGNLSKLDQEFCDNLD